MLSSRTPPSLGLDLVGNIISQSGVNLAGKSRAAPKRKEGNSSWDGKFTCFEKIFLLESFMDQEKTLRFFFFMDQEKTLRGLREERGWVVGQQTFYLESSLSFLLYALILVRSGHGK